MTDEIIMRMVQETCQVLSGMPWHEGCTHLLPSYNALLQAAKANHPDDPILSVLPLIDTSRDEGINAAPLNILFTQFRIALEVRQGETAHHPSREATVMSRNPVSSVLARVDLRDVNLRGARLDGAVLNEAKLSGADLRDANLTHANLTHADLSDSDLRGANLSGANLTHAKLAGVRLREANLSGLDLSGVDLSGANLSGMELAALLRTLSVGPPPAREDQPALAVQREEPAAGARGGGGLAEWEQARLARSGVDTTGVELDGARLEGADLTGVHWFGANLRDADLTNASLAGADLTGADLTGANLGSANLAGANLSGATLPGVDLSGMELAGVDLSGATLSDVAGLLRRMLREAQGPAERPEPPAAAE